MAYPTFAVVLDASSYEPWINMQTLKDMGISGICLRLNYPLSLSLGDHLSGKGNAVDIAFEKHYNEAYKVDLPVGVFYNHLAVADIEGSFEATHNQWNWIKNALSGKKIYWFSIAWEIMHYYNSAGVKTFHTGANNAKSLKQLYADVYNGYSGHLPISLYSRRSLIDYYGYNRDGSGNILVGGGNHVQTWIDNEKDLLLWMAYYPTHPLANQIVTSATQFKEKTTELTADLRSKYLWAGTKSPWMWQVGDKFLTNGVKNELGALTAIDYNIVWQTQEQFYTKIGFTGTTPAVTSTTDASTRCSGM